MIRRRKEIDLHGFGVAKVIKGRCERNHRKVKRKEMAELPGAVLVNRICVVGDCRFIEIKARRILIYSVKVNEIRADAENDQQDSSYSWRNRANAL